MLDLHGGVLSAPWGEEDMLDFQKGTSPPYGVVLVKDTKQGYGLITHEISRKNN